MAKGQQDSLFKTVSAVLTGLAGLAAYVYLAGGIVLAVRLNHAGFSPMPTVTQLPKEQVVGTGLIAVVAPTLLLVLVAIVGIGAEVRSPDKKKTNLTAAVRRHVRLALPGAIVLGAIAWLLFANPTYGYAFGISILITYAVGVAVGNEFAGKIAGDWQLYLLVAIAIGLIGAGARVALDLTTTTLPTAVVCETGGAPPQAGVLIGQSSTTVFLGQKVHGKPTTILEIPTATVANLLVGTGDPTACPATAPRASGTM